MVQVTMSEILKGIKMGRVSTSDLEPHEPVEQAVTKSRGSTTVWLLRALADARNDPEAAAQRALLDALIQQQETYDAAHPDEQINIDVKAGYL